MREAKTLEFENPHFLHALFANDLSLLKYLEEALGVTTTTRDGWLKLEGEKGPLERACGVIKVLESSRREGLTISEHEFKYAVDNARRGKGNGSLEEVSHNRLSVSSVKPPVVARTPGQLSYLRAFEGNDVVFGIGPAGTGKTFLAMAQALSLLRDQKVDRVILTRPAVEAGEALGFLPGDLKEKIFPYLRPLYDALYDMLQPEEVERYIERGMIEIAPLAYMRGRTLNRACVILDEAQNTTCEQMFMFLTRLGSESKCLVTGDISQVDLKPNIRSGLEEARVNLKGIDRVAFHFFEKVDVVRHPVVQSIISAYDSHREKK